MSMKTGLFIGFVKDGKLLLDFPHQFKAFVKQFTGCEVEIEIREKRQKRSHAQNAGFHSMITPWCRDEGHAVDELKRDLLREIFGTVEYTSPINGEVSLVPAKAHTSKLTVQEFCLLIEETMRIAAECGYILVSPEEYKQAKAEAEKQAAKKAKAA